MGKKGKFILIFGLIFVLFISGIIVFKNREDRINQANKEIEQLVEMKEYDKLRTLFMDYEKMNKNFGLTEEECVEIKNYFYMLQMYKEKDYDMVYSISTNLKAEKCWIFKNDVEIFVKEFLESKEGIEERKKIEDREKLAQEIKNLRKEMGNWGREHISEIGPYIGMPESLISKTMLGYQDKTENISFEYREDIYIYEKHYMWKDDKENEICKVIVGQEEYEYEPVVKEVEFLGSNWEKKLLYNGEDENLKKEFTIGIYTGKLYEESNHGGYDNIKTDVELIEEYIDEYDVYEYSDADEFYYDHKDDFEGYEDAEGYYEDAWSLIDENTEYLIR